MSDEWKELEKKAYKKKLKELSDEPKREDCTTCKFYEKRIQCLVYNPPPCFEYEREEPKRCPECDYIFKVNEEHLKDTHRNRCNVCGRRFVLFEEWSKHIRRYHKDVKH